MYDDISVKELKQRINNNEDIIIIDVRSKSEVESDKIDTSIHIPAGELAGHLNDLDPDKEYILYYIYYEFKSQRERIYTEIFSPNRTFL